MALRHHAAADDLKLTKTMTTACPPVTTEMIMNLPGQLNQRDTVSASLSSRFRG